MQVEGLTPPSTCTTSTERWGIILSDHERWGIILSDHAAPAAWWAWLKAQDSGSDAANAALLSTWRYAHAHAHALFNLRATIPSMLAHHVIDPMRLYTCTSCFWMKVHRFSYTKGSCCWAVWTTVNMSMLRLAQRILDGRAWSGSKSCMTSISIIHGRRDEEAAAAESPHMQDRIVNLARERHGLRPSKLRPLKIPARYWNYEQLLRRQAHIQAWILFPAKLSAFSKLWNLSAMLKVQ